MAALIHRLLLKRPPRPQICRLSSSSSRPLLEDPQPSPYLRGIQPQISPLLPPFPNAPAGSVPLPLSRNLSHQVYPSFPHIFVSAPIVTNFTDEWDAEVVQGSNDPTGVWADSVKKKRKRKMNKHKYRKLKKSLRRKA